MKFKKYYIVANTRNEFQNESLQSSRPYSDHPSEESINFVISELTKAGFETELFGGVEQLIKAYEKKQTFTDIMFLNFSDGLSHISRKAQSAILLELLNVPYAGSDPLARLMAGNKAYAKQIVAEKLDTPKSITLFKHEPIPDNLQFPIVIKPNREGSSLGITQESICTNLDQLKSRAPKLLEKFQEVLVEEYIAGYEVTCFVIGNRGNYYLTEPIMCEYNGQRYFEHFVFGLEEKANRTRKEYLAREVLPTSQIEEICWSAQTAFELLNMHDFARVDFRLRRDGRLSFIEINGNAVISETSEVGVISRTLERPFGEIVGNIILAATERLGISRD